MFKEKGKRKKENKKVGFLPSSFFLLPFSSRRGFTLIEILVGTAIFLIVCIGIYNAYVALFKLIDLGQYRVLAVSLANEQFEIARNLPYSSVGVQGSIPNGIIPHIQNLTRGGVDFTVTSIVRNVDLDFDGTIGGSPNDLSPADNKLVQVTVSCSDCHGLQPITLAGQVAPKNLETASTNGALFIRVFDANGQPVKDADVHVVNIATTTTIVIDDVTDTNGMLQLVDVPPQGNAYRITVSKSGYSTDRTYPYGALLNPTPIKQDATILLQQVTQVSFAIDRLGTLAISSVTPTCTPVGNFDFNLSGSKLIGTGVLKYSANTATNGSGVSTLNNMEWDTYTFVPNDPDYGLVGINPLNPATLNPSATQNVQLIVMPADPKMLLVTVKDSATKLPISSTTVTLSKTGWTSTQITGKGYFNQTDWSGGSGQNSYTQTNKYWSNDGNIDDSVSPGEITLKNAFGTYNPSGYIESSTMDTGSPSNFYTFTWSPTDQSPLVGAGSVKFQVATNATITSTTTWSFKGPDSTAGTYYTIPNTTLSVVHNNDQFLRYRTYLSTATATVTPNVSDVGFTFTSSCTPPGQVIFPGLSASTYNLNVSKSGYSTYDQPVTLGGDWQEIEVLLAP